MATGKVEISQGTAGPLKEKLRFLKERLSFHMGKLGFLTENKFP